MATEREEKLAAARKKLARFQQTKTVNQSVGQHPVQEIITRGPADLPPRPVSPTTSEINGHNLQYSNPTPTYQSVEVSHQQTVTLNAIQLAELEASKIQLREHQADISALKNQLQEETEKTHTISSIVQVKNSELESLNACNVELVMNIEKLNAEILKIEAAKNDELNQLRAVIIQNEHIITQHQQQMQNVQGQIEEYRKQVSINENNSISNQHQLHGRVQQQESAIHHLVEEKAELMAKVKVLEELGASNRSDIDNKAQEYKQMEDRLHMVKGELKNFKDYCSENESQRSQLDEKFQYVQQTCNRFRQENDVFKRREEENKLMIEQLQEQLRSSFVQLNETNEKKNMAEASLSQLSCGSEAVLQERNNLINKMKEVEDRYDQLRSQLDEVKIERHNLRNTNHVTSVKFQSAIDDMNNQIVYLKHENDDLRMDIEKFKDNEIALNNKEDVELDELNKQLSSQAETLYELQDRIELETGAREQCEQKIQDMRYEKQLLEAQISKIQETAEAFQRRCSELEELECQTRILIESSQSDKSTISRVMQQNEKLKDEFSELQMQLGRVTNEKADLMVQFGTAEHSLNRALGIIEEYEETQSENQNWRVQLEEHTEVIQKLKHEIEMTKQESKNLLQQNSELTQSLAAARDQLRHRNSAQDQMVQTNEIEIAETKSTNSSSYSILDYESDRTSSSDNIEEEGPAHDDKKNISSIASTDLSLSDHSQVKELEEERHNLMGQLVEAKQKQLKLLNEVDGIATTRPEVHEYEALKSAKSALEKKFVEIVDQNASIKDENEKLEALVHQLSAETDTIIEYVALYRQQRSALAQKERERSIEIQTLSQSKTEIQTRVNELELLLKSTVQNIKHPGRIKNNASESVDETTEDHEEQDDDFEVIEGTDEDLQQKNIDKILDLLEEIKDPFAGQRIPAMIGLEYIGNLHTI